MPDLQVFTLLVSLGFDTMEEEKKAKGEREKSSTIQQQTFSLLVSYLVLVIYFRFLFSLELPSAHPPAL